MASTNINGNLFDLPPEIRTIIYELVLINQTAKNFGSAVELLPDIVRAKRSESERHRRLHLSRHPYPASCLAILQTCRAINDEASGILYGNHEFMFHDDLTITPSIFSRNPEPVNVKFRDFLWATSSARLDNIAKIHIFVTGAFLSSSELARLPNLKNLTIRLRGFEAMRMFRPGIVHLLLLPTGALAELQNRLQKVLELAVFIHNVEEMMSAREQLASVPHLKKLYVVVARPSILSDCDDWVFDASDLWNPRDVHTNSHASYSITNPKTFERLRSAILELGDVKEWNFVYRKLEDIFAPFTRRMNYSSMAAVRSIE
ncbi:hypothetical protein AC578_5328 [Pseudocercospora eumusae]|uniref:DUF7730 domain-containing protein n=1 Tax=Pseudocercospora eumusae TaxID=321146 RepID=A0A139GUG7_9PEZI|nr:hypothetical protein AC578_5328 [Pseudocercospora eumusae]